MWQKYLKTFFFFFIGVVTVEYTKDLDTASLPIENNLTHKTHGDIYIQILNSNHISIFL